MQELEKLVIQIRRDILRMVHQVSSGHPGGSLGCAEFLTVLYKEQMTINPDDFQMEGHGEDLFVLSNGHISPVWYSILSRVGYFPISELSTFRKIDSRLQGHPTTHEGLPGVRVASGSLGQGLSVALGMAEAKKLNKDQKLVYTLHGDGELQEGQIWEGVIYAGAKKIDNIIATIDANGRQIDGDTDDVMSLGSLEDKFKAFGWEVLNCKKGNDIQLIRKVLVEAKNRTGKQKPVVIILKTEMGNGVDFMMGTHKWHGATPNDEQLEIALAQNLETLGDY